MTVKFFEYEAFSGSRTISTDNGHSEIEVQNFFGGEVDAPFVNVEVKNGDGNFVSINFTPAEFNAFVEKCKWVQAAQKND